MASSKSLTLASLKALGAARLADLLIEIADADAVVKRRLRLELAGKAGVGEVAREIGKRLAAIGKTRAFVERRRVGALAADLETQHRAIVDHVGKADPAQALDLLWRFLALAERIYGRSDDSDGRLGEVFRTAARDLAPIAAAANAEPRALAERIFDALSGNGNGQYDELIGILAPCLGREGLEHLETRVVALGAAPPTQPSGAERKVIGWGSGGPMYADDLEERQREHTVRHALEQIADAQGDVDGFIAQQGTRAREVPMIAAAIARRLLSAGRAAEALAALDAVGEDRSGWIPIEWEQARIDALVALGRTDDAQAFRWQCFAHSLNAAHLRAYLKALPDFDDIDAEERAMALALGYPNITHALAFLIGWPALGAADRLVRDRARELDGDHYEVLTPAADALDARYPLAATLVRRAMIDFALTRARVKRYPHAARHLADCARLAAHIEDFGSLLPHDAYVAQLRAAHGRKTAFWQA